MKILKTSLVIILCLVITASTLLLLAVSFLRVTLLKVDFYDQVISSTAYLPLVRSAIEKDLAEQSRYVDIPLEHLIAGIDNNTIYAMLHQHIDNVIDFLNNRTEFAKPTYPAAKFEEPLALFIETYAAENGFVISEEQRQQLRDVAADSALIVQQHVSLINLDLVKDRSFFQKAHQLILRFAGLLPLFIVVFIIAFVALAALDYRRWRNWLSQILIGLWLAGSVLLVPSLVLDWFALPRRLAIETQYLQLAVGRLLSEFSRYFLIWGYVLFIITSVALITIYMTTPYKRKRRNSTTDLRNLAQE